MALYAFDGTWNSDHQDPQLDTNVVHFRSAYESGEAIYYSGPGTRLGWVGRIAGGLTGAGGHTRVREALKAVQRNIARGDSTIDVVGFSRGAALALHFANSLAPCVRVRFLGLWDTVPSFGVPGNSIDIGWKLDMPLWVDHCFHAMALDETRYNFLLHRLPPNPRLSQVWFRGAHSDVGGGNGNHALSSITLDWMFEAAHRCGIRLKTWRVMENRVRMNPAAPITRSMLNSNLRPRPVEPGDVLHRSVRLAESYSRNEPEKAA
jgi:uncharacterized protein (DUF2235 family)